MRYLLIVLFVVIAGNAHCQHLLSIIICDSSGHTALCYATAINFSTSSGAISNNEGKCLIPYRTKKDSIIISYVGYSTMKCQIDSLISVDTVFLVQEQICLSAVTITQGTKESDYANQLYDVFEFNKHSNNVFRAKANLLLKSFVDSLPLERIESVGNLCTNQGGVVEYIHRMGRVGQNCDNNFFTLSVVSLLKKFQLFSSPSRKLPAIITQQNKHKINSLYYLSRNMISERLTKINFESKTGDLFSGFVIFDTGKHIINFHLALSGTANQFLEPIFANHSIRTLSIEYDIKFSEQTYQPSTINLKYDFVYDYGNSIKKHIKSDVIVFVTGSNSQFSNPVYSPNKTNNLTDYQQIIILPFDSASWEQNYIYAQNADDSLSLNFFKKYGYITNFLAYKTDATLKSLLNGMVSWNGNQNICFADFNNNYEANGIKRENLKDVHEQYFNDELINLDIGYMIIPEQISNDFSKYDVTTFINTSNSFYFLLQDFYSQIAVNLYFDVFEKNRVGLEMALTKVNSEQEALNLSNSAYSKSKTEADLLFKQCKKGALIKPLLNWNQTIDSVLASNRVTLAISDYVIKSTLISDSTNNELFDILTSIGSAFMEMKEAQTSLKYLRSALPFQKMVSKNKVGQLYYEIGLAYTALDEPDKACVQYENAILFGNKTAKIFFDKFCK